MSLLHQVPAESTKGPEPACEKQGRRREAGGRSLPFRTFPKGEESSPIPLALLGSPRHFTHSPGKLLMVVPGPPEWQGVRHATAMAKRLPRLSVFCDVPGLVFWHPYCSPWSCYDSGGTGETCRPEKDGVWVNSLSQGRSCFPKVRHKNFAADRVIKFPSR